jgi:hypothetical protein
MKFKGKGKAILVLALIVGPEGSRSLRLPDFKTIDTRWYSCQTYAPTPQEIFLVLISVRGWDKPRVIVIRIMSVENSNPRLSQCLNQLLYCVPRIQRDATINSYKAPVTLVRFSWNLNIIDTFSKKNVKISNFVKIRPIGTGQTS